ncbi:MAG: B12-binding domain-containing radical SAM protein [Candidatus Latescibacterota bacterium]|nr:MAG: B12-binding domain-containing radical SAM protein [Candidatus Latescibacterota bacterium]
MRLLLINPSNRLSSMVKIKENRWNKYRVWKPLGLLVLAGMTPNEWKITVVDENLGLPGYEDMPQPDLVGITAFTSQAPRAYEIAAQFRARGVPIVMGGIHASMCTEEALERVDAVVTGEAEGIWPQVLEDVKHSALKRIYEGGHADAEKIPLARQDLLPDGYFFGSVQAARGCPLNCSFCSVSTFNGRKYRRRAIADVVAEFKSTRESHILIVDDNLIGTSAKHIADAKELFRALIRANLGKKWIAQATVNMADDDELLELAAKAGCVGVFIGFESPSEEGLAEVRKKFNSRKGRDFRTSVRRIQRHGMVVAGSFIVGLDVDKPGIGERIAAAANHYGLDLLNVNCLTPLPGTDLWNEMEAEDRIVANDLPEDWKYYTLTLPVAEYKHLSRTDVLAELNTCNWNFYSLARVVRRAWGWLGGRRKPVFSLVSNLSNRNNARLYRGVFQEFATSQDRNAQSAPGSGDLASVGVFSSDAPSGAKPSPVASVGVSRISSEAS